MLEDEKNPISLVLISFHSNKKIEILQSRYI